MERPPTPKHALSWQSAGLPGVLSGFARVSEIEPVRNPTGNLVGALYRQTMKGRELSPSPTRSKRRMDHLVEALETEASCIIRVGGL